MEDKADNKMCEKGNDTTLYKYMMMAILALSSLVVLLNSTIATVRTAPDEAHHYSYAKYVSENPLPFPPDLGNTFTEREGRYNHLAHPPLYYYLLAVPLKILRLQKHFTSIGKEMDRYGKHSNKIGIELLRRVSFFFYILYLVGIYLLLAYFVEKSFLNRTIAVILSLIINFIPGFTYIGGMLNNDVLCMALWPLLTLSVSKFFCENDYRFFWWSLFYASLCFLTKATLWPMAMIFFVFISLKLLCFSYRNTLKYGYKNAFSTVINQRTLPSFLLAVVMMLLSLIYMASNIHTYGRVLVGHTQRYNLTLKESKFYKMTDDFEPKSYPEVAKATGKAFRSLIGIMGHTERIYKNNWEKSLSLFLYISFFCILAGITFQGRILLKNQANILYLLFVALSLFFTLYYTYRCYRGYNHTAYFASQGRYFIGYLEIYIIGFVGLFWNAVKESVRFQNAYSILTAIILFFLLCIFFDPFFYFRNTKEIYLKAKIPALIQSHLSRSGYQKVDLTFFKPEKLHRQGYARNPRSGLPDYYQLAWKNSTLGGIIPPVQEKCIDIGIWAHGDSAYLKNAQLGIGFGYPGKTPENDFISKVVSMEDKITFKNVTLELPSEAGRTMLFVKALNSHDTRSIFYKIWPDSRVIKLFGLYFKEAPCR